MNRRAERPSPFVLIPDDRMAPHGQSRHGEGGDKPDHRRADQIIINVAGREKRRRCADCDL